MTLADWRSHAKRATHALLDIVFPPSARERHVRMLVPDDFSLAPATTPLGDSVCVTLLSYTNPAVHDLIAALKYERSEHAAQICADLLADWLLETLAEATSFSSRVLLVPIPLFATRERKRGFNQITFVLEHLDPALLIPRAEIRTDLLVRTRDTKTQTALSRTDRLRNVASAFALAYPESLHGTHVMLLDDVTTTGATLLEAAKPLLEAGARVTAIAFAHA